MEYILVTSFLTIMMFAPWFAIADLGFGRMSKGSMRDAKWMVVIMALSHAGLWYLVVPDIYSMLTEQPHLIPCAPIALGLAIAMAYSYGI